MVVKAGVENPPDLTLTIPVDIRGLNDSESDLEGVGVSFVLLTSPLPTNTEGELHSQVPERLDHYFSLLLRCCHAVVVSRTLCNKVHQSDGI